MVWVTKESQPLDISFLSSRNLQLSLSAAGLVVHIWLIRAFLLQELMRMVRPDIILVVKTKAMSSSEAKMLFRGSKW